MNINSNLTGLKAHHHSCKLMGCHFVLSAVDSDPENAWNAIRAAQTEIERIECLISSWYDSSETSIINKQAGLAPVKVSKELFYLIDRAVKISALTSGAFDISGTLSRFYWHSDGSNQEFLEEREIEKLKSLIDYRNIQLNEGRKEVFLKKKGMRIGFGAIGKGYAAMKAKDVMTSYNVYGGLINASGDIMCWGHSLGEEGWTIKIPDPSNYDMSLIKLTIPEGAVVTSGSHYNFVLVEGEKYSHIIDPRSGVPIRGSKSVSVLSPNSEFADAMATALSVMELTEGLNLINKLNGIECVIVDSGRQIHYSNGLNSNSSL